MSDRVLAPFLIVVALATAAPVPFPKPGGNSKAVLARMQGLWAFVDFERVSGKVTHPFPMYAKVEGEKWTFMQKRPDGSLSPTRGYTILIDPKKTPAWIDFRNAPADKEPFLLGVFVVEKDELRVAYAIRTTTTDRPGGLKAVRPADYLLTLKRVAAP